MKSEARERALRSMVAALLGSGLPADDIREVAALLTSDPDFAERFTAMLDAVLSHLPPPKARSQLTPSTGRTSPRTTPATTDHSDVDEVLRIIDQLRIPKKDLVSQLQSHRALADWQPNPSWSRRQIIESVVRRVPRAKLPDVLAAVTVGRGPVDPWMEGLAARGRKDNGRH